MDLEVHEMKQPDQSRLRTRLDSYRAELGRLQKEFKQACSASTNPNSKYEMNFSIQINQYKFQF